LACEPLTFDGFAVATGFQQEKERSIADSHNHHPGAWMRRSPENQNTIWHSEWLSEKEAKPATQSSELSPASSKELHILTSVPEVVRQTTAITERDLQVWQCSFSSSGSTIIGNSSSSSTSELQSEVSSARSDVGNPLACYGEPKENYSMLGSKLHLWSRNLGAQSSSPSNSES